jgi:hypothetical protein
LAGPCPSLDPGNWADNASLSGCGQRGLRAAKGRDGVAYGTVRGDDRREKWPSVDRRGGVVPGRVLRGAEHLGRRHVDAGRGRAAKITSGCCFPPLVGCRFDNLRMPPSAQPHRSYDSPLSCLGRAQMGTTRVGSQPHSPGRFARSCREPPLFLRPKGITDVRRRK